jgi:hypothetical protein
MLKINGLLIDCARTIEKHGYYSLLVDFMADWGMNTLLFHFTLIKWAADIEAAKRALEESR